MTKEITKAIILQQLQDRLKLREFDPAKFLLDETVVPTFDIRGELEVSTLAQNTKNITATGASGFFIVPQNERWRLTRYDVVFMTGAFTVAGMYWRKGDSVDNFVYLDLKAAQDTSYHITVNPAVVMPPNSFLNVNVDGFTSAGSLRVYIEYIKEELR